MKIQTYQENGAINALKAELAAFKTAFDELKAEREAEKAEAKDAKSRVAEAAKQAEEAAKAALTPQKKYEVRLEELIRQKYTSSQEFAILRQRDYKPDEFNAYWEYAEKCKVQAKAEVLGIKSEPHANIIEEEVL